ncbi:probable carboxylesterase 5 [Malania oleifera]|uniref:probable carboxylesterase 5 n=1 Tax=Malania oleifera TaxID=397392 RepID=UPI0025AEA7A3|nr:probable carboxylesterase 5 [Malania oleifera]
MDITSTNEITHDFSPFFKVYKDGRIERCIIYPHLPPTVDPHAAVQSLDVVFSPELGLRGRLFFPKLPPVAAAPHKLPLLLHFHGGGFCVGSPFDAVCQNYLHSLIPQVNAIIVSVDYRLAPEHRLPIAYEDSWAALHWVAAHLDGHGPEPFLNQHVDFGRVFLAGDSAGANIAHYVAVRAGVSGSGGLKPRGMILIQPLFGGPERDKLYRFLCPSSKGWEEDPKLNPAVDPDMKTMGCGRVLVCVAEKDRLRDWAQSYYETLKESEWVGSVEMDEVKGVGHCFHLFNPTSKEALALFKRLSAFINQD